MNAAEALQMFRARLTRLLEALADGDDLLAFELGKDLESDVEVCLASFAERERALA